MRVSFVSSAGETKTGHDNREARRSSTRRPRRPVVYLPLGGGGVRNRVASGVLVLLALAGCASGGGTTGASPTERRAALEKRQREVYAALEKEPLAAARVAEAARAELEAGRPGRAHA